MAKSGHKGVSRIDQPSKKCHGWYVRVAFNGTKASKFFNDEKCGGRDEGLKAAVQWRNEQEAELGKPRTERQIIPLTKRNTSGVVGVRKRVRSVKGRNGKPSKVEYFEVSWSPWPGKLCRKLFSVEKFGESQAFLKACQFRREREREFLGDVVKGNWRESFATVINH